MMTRTLSLPAAIAAFVMIPASATPAAAQQQSESYKFLNAVRDAKGDEVTEMLDKPGSSIINTRDISSGEGALHIVVKRGDATYLRYLLQKGADANLRDAKGNTPLLLAVQTGQADMIPILIAGKANPNLGNQSGITPLILATQARNLDMVRQLLAANADPDVTDRIAGQSARDYAAGDPRNTTIARLYAATPKRSRAAVSGPKF